MNRFQIILLIGLLWIFGPFGGNAQGFSGAGVYLEGGFCKGYEPLYYPPPKWTYKMVPKFETVVFSTFSLAPRVYFSTELNYKFFGEKLEFNEPHYKSIKETNAERLALGLKMDYYFREIGTQAYCWGGVGLGINTKVVSYISTHASSSYSIHGVDMRPWIGKVQPNFRFGFGTGKLVTRGLAIKLETGVDCIAFNKVKSIPFYPCWIFRGIILVHPKKNRMIIHED